MKRWILRCGIVAAISTMALASFIEESPISERLAVTVISDDAGQQHIRIQNKSASTVRLIGGNAC